MPMRWAGYDFASHFRSPHALRRLPKRLQPIARCSNIRARDARKEMWSVENNPMPLLQHRSFERWDLAESTRPCPSLLYALTPCGLGTPDVESLSSYVTRL